MGKQSKFILIAYLLSNVSVKKYQNLFLFVKVIASQSLPIFFGNPVHISDAENDFVEINQERLESPGLNESLRVYERHQRRHRHSMIHRSDARNTSQHTPQVRREFIGVNLGKKSGGAPTMAIAESEPITGLWGRNPHRGPGA